MSSAMTDVPQGAAAAPAAAAAGASPPASVAAAPSHRHTYAVTAQPPTLVTHSVVCSFTGEGERNLIMIRSSRMEIYRVAPEEGGLENVTEVALYARITGIIVLKPAKGEKTDRLFLCTDRHKFFVLRYDAATTEVVTVAMGDSKLKIGRPSDAGCLALLDPTHSWLALQQYCGLVQVLGVDPVTGVLAREMHECKLDAMQVIQMVWLQGQAKPTLLVLSQDQEDVRSLRSYTYEAKELKPAPSAINVKSCDKGTVHVIATEMGGVIVVAEESISYLPTGGRASVKLDVVPWACTAFGAVDRARFLLGDLEGGLHALLLLLSGDVVTGLKLEYLGTTSIAHNITYIDNGFVLIGSQYGDSQLIRMHTTPQPLPGEAEDEEGADEAKAMDVDEGSAAAASAAPKRPNFISIERTYEHLGPITDFAMLDLERNGQGAMMACCGAYKDGSLRIVRNGIGVHEAAAIPLEGIQGMWSLLDPAASNASPATAEFKTLVQTFATETRVLSLEHVDGAVELGECEIEGFDAAQRTLFCGNVAGGHILQVTQHSARLVDQSTLKLVHEFRAPAASGAASSAFANLTVASANVNQVLLAAGRVLMLLTVQGSALQLQSQVTMEEEISCLDVTPLNGASSAQFAAVCMWHDNTVRLLKTSNLEEVTRERLGETVARSVLLAHFDVGTSDAASFVLCGLGDGNLMSFEVAAASGAISGRKKIAIGTTGIELRSFWSNMRLHVFASCDRPTVVSCANGKLLYSNVNVQSGVAHMAPFHAPGTEFDHCLAMASPADLMIGRVDDIQKLHIQTVVTGGQPRRLAHHLASKTLAVAVVERVQSPALDDLSGEQYKLKVYDANSFTWQSEWDGLKTNETVTAMANMKLDTQKKGAAVSAGDAGAPASSWPEYLVVGTSYLNPEESEPTAGRLLVFSIDASSGSSCLKLESEASIKGGVLVLSSIQGRIIAGINARVVVYRCVPSTATVGEFRLENVCDYVGNVLVLQLSVSRDQQYVMVGDLMKGVCVLHYLSRVNSNTVQSAEGDCSISEVARDYESHWVTAMASFSDADDVCVVAEHFRNLVTLQRQTNPSLPEDERARMECIGRWHCGQLVNKIARGSLIMQLPSEPDAGAAALGALAASAPAASSSSSSSSSSSVSPFDRVVPTHLYGTLEGGIGVLAPLSSSSFQFFARMEEELEKIVRGVGNLAHKEWRAFHSDRRTEDSKGFIDGDLVEQFLQLAPAMQEGIAQKLGVGVAECIKRVEDAHRIH